MKIVFLKVIFLDKMPILGWVVMVFFADLGGSRPSWLFLGGVCMGFVKVRGGDMFGQTNARLAQPPPPKHVYGTFP